MKERRRGEGGEMEEGEKNREESERNLIYYERSLTELTFLSSFTFETSARMI